MVDEVLGMYEERGKVYDAFCLLQPTSPLRDADDIINALNIFNSKNAFAVVSVCEAEHSPLWCGRLPENHEFIDFIQSSNAKQRQALGKFYRLNGAIFYVRTERFKKDRNLYQSGGFAYIMTPEHSVDIDTELDFKFAELIIREQDAEKK